MSNDTHLDELGGDLDQALRSAVMAASQMGENLARRSANRQQQQAAALRQGFLDRRDQARQVYLPLTQKLGAERATPAQLYQGWAAASQWATTDPKAATAQASIAERFTHRFGVAPDHGMPGAWEKTGANDQGQGQYTFPLNAQEAFDLAEANAPAYYTRHLDEQSRGAGGSSPQQDWWHWLENGELPQRTLREEWAHHIGELDAHTAALDAAWNRDVDGPTGAEADAAMAAYDAALERSWAKSGQLTDQEAISLAEEHAPAYYTRHHPDALALDGDTDQLRSDWQQWRKEGQLPLLSRQEEWAAFAGRGEEFNPRQWEDRANREVALQQAWDEGRDERGLMEMTDHLDQMDDAGLDTALVVDSTLVDDIDQFRLDRDTAREAYTPLLDQAAFNAADQAAAVAAWQSAAAWSGQDPAAQAAAAQFDQQFQHRWGVAPMDYLLVDQVIDHAANRTETQRADQARQVVAEEMADAAGLDEDHDTHLQEATDTDDPAERQRHFADAARAAAGADELRQDVDELSGNSDSEDTGDAPQEPAARYDRAAESDLDGPEMTDAARQARIESAPAFSRSLRESLNNRDPKAGSKNQSAKPAQSHTLSTEHDLGR